MISEIQRVFCRAAGCIILMASINGCAGAGTSRWAMDDPVYAEKYKSPYTGDDTEKVASMMKQSVDARYVDGQSGFYVGAAGSDEPITAGAELGVFQYLNHSVESRVGLKGLIGTGAEDAFLGADLGLRVQAPTRLAPFAGVGTYLGGSLRSESAEDDHLDNDDDGSVDERGETKSVGSGMASVYPELGAHFWLNGKTRLTTSAQYHLTTDGRDSDFWFIGLSIAFLNGQPPAME